MHPHLTDVFRLLDDSHAAVRAAVAAVPADARRRKASPDQWSVAEVLEHLALAEERFTASVSEAIDQARRAGLDLEQGERTPLDDVIRRRLLDRSEKREAPEAMLPTGRLDDAVAWAAYEQAHQAFRRTVSGADGLALGSVVADHRRWGPLTIYQWVEVLAGHERRHAEQIRQLAQGVA